MFLVLTRWKKSSETEQKREKEGPIGCGFTMSLPHVCHLTRSNEPSGKKRVDGITVGEVFHLRISDDDDRRRANVKICCSTVNTILIKNLIHVGDAASSQHSIAHSFPIVVLTHRQSGGASRKLSLRMTSIHYAAGGLLD